jgi:hypothetical protein
MFTVLTRKNKNAIVGIGSLPFPLVATIGKTSTCHKERRKSKREERELAIVDVLAHGAAKSMELIPTTDEYHFGYIRQNPPNFCTFCTSCVIGGANRPKNQPPKSQGP